VALRWRLAVMFALATAAVLAVAAVVVLRVMQHNLDDSVHSRLRGREASLARLVLTRSDALRNRPLRSDLLHSPYTPEADETAQIFAPDGNVVLSHDVRSHRPLLDGHQFDAARTSPVEFRASQGTAGSAQLVRASAATDLEGDRWVVVVGADLTGVDAVLSRLRTGFAVGGAIGIGLAASGAWLLAGATLRPVEKLRREAEVISAADTSASLPVPGTRDEVAELARTMNRLLGRLQHALSQQRRFVADAGHQLRTPLTVLRAELELASRPHRTREELREAVTFAAVETDRLIQLAEQLLLLARADEGSHLLELAPTSLHPLLVNAAEDAMRTRTDVDVRVDAPEEVTVLADRERLRQAVGNLLDNALRYAPPRSRISVRLRSQTRPSGRLAVIEVADRGMGFAAQFLPRAFERFERGDSPNGGGNGLGLAIARGLARAHGGDAVAMNQPGGGALVRLELPLSAAPSSDARGRS
jgi:two-component system OmpR family sensor kinase